VPRAPRVWSSQVNRTLIDAADSGGVLLAKGCQDNLGAMLEVATGQGCLTIERLGHADIRRPRRLWLDQSAPYDRSWEAVDDISRRV
jgi:hypothetical protein